MNNQELEKAALQAADRCLKGKGHIALVEVFLEMGRLTKKQHEDWRMGRVPYLEQILGMNLSKITTICRAVHASAVRGKLKASWTAYVKLGKGARTPLRFTKSGDPKLERLWATHYLMPKATVPASPDPAKGTEAC
jgi:hypothetical protein